ncbi:hypothetical protein [Desulfotalea psychrophila]|nr:hypothetical protein [Desulfotalea psychrophila]
MFIDIKANEGIFKTGSCIGNTAGLESYHSLRADFKFNLQHAREVYFGKFEQNRLPEVINLMGDHLPWEDMVGNNYIAFDCKDSDENNSYSFTLFFSYEAMDQYNRIKKIVDEQTWK